MDRLARSGAIAAFAAGILEITAQIIPYVPNDPALETLYGAVDIAFLTALVAMVGVLAPRLGWAALLPLLLAIAGVASIVGPDKTAFGIDFYQLGSAVFVLALGIAALPLLRLPDYRRPALIWVGTAVLALVAGASGEPAIFRATSVALALGFITLAPILWRERREG